MIVTTQRSPCWASFGYVEPWNNRGFDVLGYPFLKETGCFYNSGYFSSCSYSTTDKNDLRLLHRCDTSGMAGAPLMSEYPDSIGRDRGQKGVLGVN